MSLLFESSFDAGSPLGAWTTATGVSIVVGRTLNGAQISASSNLTKVVSASLPGTPLVGGAAVNTTAFANLPLVIDDSNGTMNAQLAHVGDGRLNLFLGSYLSGPDAKAGPSTFVMNLVNFFYLELFAEVTLFVVTPLGGGVSSVQIGATASVRVNNTQILSVSYSATQTLPDASVRTPVFNRFSPTAPGGGLTMIWDDVYISNDGFQGDGTVPPTDDQFNVNVVQPRETHHLMETLQAPAIDVRATHMLLEIVKSNTPLFIALACPLLTSGTVGILYSSALVVGGGTPPFTFAIIFGSLPTGLTLNTSTGVISGIPTLLGSYTYTAQVTDVNLNTATATCSTAIQGSGSCRTELFLWQHTASPQVEIITDRYDDWNNSGTIGNKFYQGFRLDADTFGQNKSISIRDADTNTLHAIQPSPINHAGRQTHSYSFVSPFLAHSVRRESQDLVPWRMFEIDYVYELTPSSVQTWKTQFTAHGLKGYQHVARIEAAYASSTTVTLQLTSYDGTSPAAVTLPSTGGVYQKLLVTLTLNKGQAYQYSATSSGPFQLFLEDWIVWVGQWGRTDGYLRYANLGHTFGDKATI
jgi:hypothetical protein